MKRTLSILLTVLMVCCGSFSASAAPKKASRKAAQKAPQKEQAIGNEHTPWFRQVKQDQPEYNCPVLGDSTRTVKVFAGEWVKVQGQFNGNIIIANDTLATDNAGCTNTETKDTVAEAHSDLPIIYFAVVDSLYITGQVDTLNYMVIDHGKGILLKQFMGKDTLKLVAEVDSATILRIAPDGHIATFLAVADVPGYGEKPQEPAKSEGKGWVLWAIIGGAVLILLIAGFFVLRKISARKAVEEELEKDLPDATVTPLKQKGGNTGKPEGGKLGKPEGGKLGKPEGGKLVKPEGEEAPGKEEKKVDPALAAAQATIAALTKRAEAAEAQIEDAKTKAMKDAEDAINKAKKEAEDTAAKAKKDIEDAKAKAKKEVDDAKAKAQRDIDDANAKAKKKIDEADEKRRAAEAKTKTISDELEAKFATERTDLTGKITKLTTDLQTTTSTLNSTRTTLSTTETNLANAKAEISRLEDAMKKYSEVLTYVPFAKDYAAVVGRLLALSGKVQAQAAELLKLDIDDPFHIMKFISRYNRALNSIDMGTLTTEVSMIEHGEMVIKGSVISTYDQSKDKATLDAATRNYFFSNYLKYLVDALVVFNESLAGVNRLVDGVTAEDVRPFADLRSEIEKVLNELDIIVETVHLFDKVGQKTDLNAEMIDAGFATGDIIDIENTIVYLKGSHRPNTKVRVKAQS